MHKMADEKDIVQRIGTLMRNIPELHNTQYDVCFNLTENTFFRKLITNDVLEKGIRIKPRDFFKGLVLLTYFGEVLEKDYAVCDNIVAISKALRKEEKRKGQDGYGSYLSLNSILEEAGLYAKEKSRDYSDSALLAEIKGRYDSIAKVDVNAASTRPADYYHEAMGKMVHDLFSEDNRKYLADAEGRADMSALLFTDCVFQYVTYDACKQSILGKLAAKDYLGASVSAILGLRAEASRSKLINYLGEDVNG